MMPFWACFWPIKSLKKISNYKAYRTITSSKTNLTFLILDTSDTKYTSFFFQKVGSLQKINRPTLQKSRHKSGHKLKNQPISIEFSMEILTLCIKINLGQDAYFPILIFWVGKGRGCNAGANKRFSHLVEIWVNCYIDSFK